MNFYNSNNKHMLASNAIFDGECYRVKKNESEIAEVKENYLCPMDMKAAALLNKLHYDAEELLDGQEEVSFNTTFEDEEFSVNIFDYDDYYYCDVIDLRTREFFYAWDEEGPHKIYHWIDDEDEYDIEDPNMYYAAIEAWSMDDRKHMISDKTYDMMWGYKSAKQLKESIDSHLIDACADGEYNFTWDESEYGFFVDYNITCVEDSFHIKMLISVTCVNGSCAVMEKEYDFMIHDDISDVLVDELYNALEALEYGGVHEDENVNEEIND